MPELTSDSDIESICSPKPQKRKRSMKREEATTSELDTKLMEYLEKENVETEEDLFGKSVAMNLKRLQPLQRRIARQQIDSILINIEFGQPTNNCIQQIDGLDFSTL